MDYNADHDNIPFLNIRLFNRTLKPWILLFVFRFWYGVAWNDILDLGVGMHANTHHDRLENHLTFHPPPL